MAKHKLSHNLPKRGYGLTPYQADVICRHRAIADFFELMVAMGYDPKASANSIIQDFPFFKEHLA